MLCHHQDMFVNFFIDYSAFFLGVVVLFGFAAASSTAATGAGFLVVDLFSLALIALLRLELP